MPIYANICQYILIYANILLIHPRYYGIGTWNNFIRDLPIIVILPINPIFG